LFLALIAAEYYLGRFILRSAPRPLRHQCEGVICNYQFKVEIPLDEIQCHSVDSAITLTHLVIKAISMSLEGSSIPLQGLISHAGVYFLARAPSHRTVKVKLLTQQVATLCPAQASAMSLEEIHHLVSDSVIEPPAPPMSSLILELLKATLDEFLSWSSTSLPVAVIIPSPPLGNQTDNISFEMLTSLSSSQTPILVTFPDSALPVEARGDRVGRSVSVTITIHGAALSISAATEFVKSFKHNICLRER
jgi:hypothetical protein